MQKLISMTMEGLLDWERDHGNPTIFALCDGHIVHAHVSEHRTVAAAQVLDDGSTHLTLRNIIQLYLLQQQAVTELDAVIPLNATELVETMEQKKLIGVGIDSEGFGEFTVQSKVSIHTFDLHDLDEPDEPAEVSYVESLTVQKTESKEIVLRLSRHLQSTWLWEPRDKPPNPRHLMDVSLALRR